jgi:hypothetical protein
MAGKSQRGTLESPTDRDGYLAIRICGPLQAPLPGSTLIFGEGVYFFINYPSMLSRPRRKDFPIDVRFCQAASRLLIVRIASELLR